ncbi:MAG: JAB domain-containing protein, partial [Clostridia bacterium]|nr:JAB domain-containing protein [Clostridia bacterium]
PAIAQRYMIEANSRDGDFLPTMDDVGKYFTAKYIGATKETVYLLLLDNKYKIIDCVKIHEGSVNSSAITIRRLIELALETKAASAVLAHNHPGGIAVPSTDDIYTTKELLRAFTLMGVSFTGHILVAGNNYVNILDM